MAMWRLYRGTHSCVRRLPCQWRKRLTPLTYAFSNRDDPAAALALHAPCYNFCAVHGKLRVTPVMRARVTDYFWDWRNSYACEMRCAPVKA